MLIAKKESCQPTLGSIIPNGPRGLSSCPLAKGDGCQPIIWSMTSDGPKHLFQSQLALGRVCRFKPGSVMPNGPRDLFSCPLEGRDGSQYKLGSTTTCFQKTFTYAMWGGGSPSQIPVNDSKWCLPMHLARERIDYLQWLQVITKVFSRAHLQEGRVLNSNSGECLLIIPNNFFMPNSNGGVMSTQIRIHKTKC